MSAIIGAMSLWGVWLRYLYIHTDSLSRALVHGWLDAGALDEALLLLAVALFVVLGVNRMAHLTMARQGIWVPKVFSVPAQPASPGKGWRGRVILAMLLPPFAIATSALTHHGLGAAFAALQSRVSSASVGQGYLTLLIDAAGFLVLVSLLDLRVGIAGRSGPTPPAQRRILAVAALEVSLAYGFIGSRGGVVVFILSVFVVLEVTAQASGLGRATVRRLTLLSVALVVIVLGLASRRAAQRATSVNSELNQVWSNVAGNLTSSMPTIDSVALAGELRDGRVLSAEEVLAPLFSNWIPRAIWPEKPPILATIVREQLVGDSLGGIPLSVFGEALVLGGPPAVLVCAGLLGLLTAYFDRIYVQLRRRTNWVIYYVASINIVAFSLIRSDTSIAVTRAISYVAIFLILFRRRRQGERRGPADLGGRQARSDDEPRSFGRMSASSPR
jgi:hypothetical protein